MPAGASLNIAAALRFARSGPNSTVNTTVSLKANATIPTGTGDSSGSSSDGSPSSEGTAGAVKQLFAMLGWKEVNAQLEVQLPLVGSKLQNEGSYVMLNIRGGAKDGTGGNETREFASL